MTFKILAPTGSLIRDDYRRTSAQPRTIDGIEFLTFSVGVLRYALISADGKIKVDTIGRMYRAEVIDHGFVLNSKGRTKFFYTEATALREAIKIRRRLLVDNGKILNYEKSAVNEVPLMSPEPEARGRAAAKSLLIRLIAEVEDNLWQDISTAPRDGTPVLLCTVGQPRDMAPTTGAWSSLAQCWYDDLWSQTIKPTHWRPALAPPTRPEETK
jgi:hypothetical protein